jgi:hypothetical protein
MNDTSDRTERLFRKLMMARTGEQRLVMGAQMFDATRALMIAGLKAEGITGEKELKGAVFLRTYGQELSPERRERIVRRIEQAARAPGTAPGLP